MVGSAGIAFVTGGGSGIGRAIAVALAETGRAVCVMDLLPDGGEATVDAITKDGGRAEFVQGDASRWEDVDAAVTRAEAALGPVYAMVNNAGVLDGYSAAHELTPEVWTRVISINLTGVFFGSKRAVASMLKQGRGRIINISSVAGLGGTGGGAAYVASKHGVIGLTRQMAITYASSGITVNAICPGAVQTELREHSAQIIGPGAPDMSRGVGGSDTLVKTITPAARRGTVEEIAAAARYLASDEAAYVTGHTLVVDGGWTAR
jgi:NAD(P)-dependent dehydrogenase (short-subunit alcohol dehydrogenase family)